MNKELDYYIVIYNDSLGNQIEKPFFDDENGELKQIAIVHVYSKTI